MSPKSEWFAPAPVVATNDKADTPLFPFLSALIRGEDMSFDRAAEFFRALTSENANSAQIAGALAALTAKGETPEELAGMASAMREQAVHITTRHKNLIDVTGTGSSAAKTFNVSTAAALVAAGAGLTVAKQTNGAVSSRTGSAEVLAKLGVKISAEPDVTQACLNGAGICFMFAPKFHTQLQRVDEVRSGLGIHTCLNLLGVLANPARVRKQIVGVWHKSLLEPLAWALTLLGAQNAWVVHGAADGLDELTLTGETLVAEVFAGKPEIFKVTPEDFGLHRAADLTHLRAETADESASIIREVLSGNRRDEARSLVVLNAAAAILVGGLSEKPMHAARLAEQSIDSASAQTKLERLIKTTNKNRS